MYNNIIMNRSIFQIRQPNVYGKINIRKYYKFKFLYSFIITILVVLIIVYCNIIECINTNVIAEKQKYFLREIIHNNMKIKVLNTINDQNAKIALELFQNHVSNNNNVNISILKYFLNRNGILLPFDKRSPLAHLNLYIGTFNNCYINYQFSHSKMLDFNFFSFEDIIGKSRLQYLSVVPYLYSDVFQLFLDCNDLKISNEFMRLNCDLIKSEVKLKDKVQFFCDINKNKLKSHIIESLN